MKKIKYEWLFNIIIIISLLTLNLTSTSEVYENAYEILNIKNITIIGSLFTICLGIILFYRKHCLSKIVNQKYCFGKILDYILALYLSLKSSIVLLKYYSINGSYLKNTITEIINKLSLNLELYSIFSEVILNILLIPILAIIWLAIIRFVVPYVINFFKSLTKTEKIYLVIANILFFILVVLVTINTTAFNVAISHDTKNWQLFDVLFTSDSGIQIFMNSYQNFGSTENDLRQPLFAIFSFPFGMIASMSSEIFNYLPYNFMYSFFITVLQFFCISVCAIFIARMVNKESKYYSLIGYSLMFTTLFFGLNVEQYVFGIFWLLLLIHLFVCHNKSSPILFSAASGSLITNVVLLPFIIKKKNIKEYIINFFKYCFIFGSIIVIFGQAHTILNNFFEFRYTYAMGSQVNISFTNRLLQFISFIANCFISPNAIVDNQKYPHVSYQLQDVTSINILGLVLLILMIVSFIINRKKTVAKCSFGWLIFSFIILCIVGWGTVENGLIIYGIYFSWAYFILIYLLIENTFSKNKKLEFIVFTFLFILLILFNFFLDGGILDIVKFGKEFYPFEF